MVFDHISTIQLVHEELNDRKLRGMTEEEKLSLIQKVRQKINELSRSK